jgi:diketogulonate reductase-like aldo/keto reductase
MKMPSIGFGTGNLTPGRDTFDSVIHALRTGYRMIDTAAHYNNERDVAKAIKCYGLARSDIFIVTKLKHSIKTREKIIKEINRSLNELNTDYIDLYLIHAPWPWVDKGKDYTKDNLIAYQTIEEFCRNGIIRNIGLSNFDVLHLEYILKYCQIFPLVNQIPFFIGHHSSDIIDLCEKKGIIIQSSSPLASGYLLKNKILIEISELLKLTPAQIAIKFIVKKGAIPIIRSSNINHITENFNLDYNLNDETIDLLSSILGDPRKWE